jgi:hypothetical protein
LRAVAKTIADDCLLVGLGAGLRGAVADAVTEVSVLAEAGSIGSAVRQVGAAEGTCLAEHVVDAGLLEEIGQQEGRKLEVSDLHRTLGGWLGLEP